MRLVSTKTNLAILCVVMLGFFACEDESVSPRPEKQPTWWLEPDSMNLGILVLDYHSYEFIGGRVDHYALCDTCDRDSLPFQVIYNPPLDFGDITFKYTYTGDTLLYATTVWNGWGQIEYPPEFLPPSDFERLPWRFAPPISFEYYNNGGKRAPFASADTAWSRIASMDIVGEFARSDYRVGIYIYAAGSGVLYPTPDRWVVFLHRGRITEP
jgi:hypothetical protein